jgi:hypothetical protein
VVGAGYEARNRPHPTSLGLAASLVEGVVRSEASDC